MEGMGRPPVHVLSDDALVPERNWITPAPNQFTHRLTARAPYFFEAPRSGHPPDGHLEAGTQVTLLVLVEREAHCWVADGRGLYVATLRDTLEALAVAPHGA